MRNVQYAKLHNIATGAMEDSVDDLTRRFACKAKKPPGSFLKRTRQHKALQVFDPMMEPA